MDYAIFRQNLTDFVQWVSDYFFNKGDTTNGKIYFIYRPRNNKLKSDFIQSKGKLQG